MAPGSCDQSVSTMKGSSESNRGYAKMGACRRAALRSWNDSSALAVHSNSFSVSSAVRSDRAADR